MEGDNVMGNYSLGNITLEIITFLERRKGREEVQIGQITTVHKESLLPQIYSKKQPESNPGHQ